MLPLLKSPLYLSKPSSYYDFSSRTSKPDILPLNSQTHLTYLLTMVWSDFKDDFVLFIIKLVGRYLIGFLKHKKCLRTFENSKKSIDKLGYDVQI